VTARLPHDFIDTGNWSRPFIVQAFVNDLPAHPAASMWANVTAAASWSVANRDEAGLRLASDTVVVAVKHGAAAVEAAITSKPAHNASVVMDCKP
jgi:hypothetical protein